MNSSIQNQTLSAEREAHAKWERETVATASGHTIAQLREAFDRVQNPEDWKLPIDATLKASVEERRLISEAVIHFTGSTVEWTNFGRGRWNAKAAGYYAAIGA